MTVETGRDTVPPKLISGRVLSTTEVSLTFDKAVTEESAEAVSITIYQMGLLKKLSCRMTAKPLY